MITFEIRHSTAYDYDTEVSLSHHIAHLSPRDTSGQHILEHRLEASPRFSTNSAHSDHFGNVATFLTVEGAHRRLEITAITRLQIRVPDPVAPESTQGWEAIRDLCALYSASPPIEVSEFVFGSPLAPIRSELAAYAQMSFSRGQPLLAGALDLCGRIYADFIFDSEATTVMTTVQDFFKSRRGVCQDFAQLMISCLRSIGLPARYVSGYLETLPPPGRTKLVGSDASHAWLSLWCGDALGWIDIDPTNNTLPADRHITTAWGRDYGDVTPLRGVLVGGGNHKLAVSVDVRRF